MFPRYLFVIISVFEFCQSTSLADSLESALDSFSSITLDSFRNGSAVRHTDARFLTAVQLIRRNGYPVEEHKVTTIDGYILTLIRIPFGLQSKLTIRKKRVVLLQHGLGCSAIDWIMNKPDKALAYILADAGYDVFLGNLRGNSYSKEHREFTTDNPEFWKFSWHEMGIFDVPAQIDYILKITEQRRLSYIGHSMGNTVLFVALSAFPEYNSKIKVHFALAPAAFVDKKGNRLKLLSKLAVREQLALDTLGNNEIIITSVISVIRRFRPQTPYCDADKKMNFCLSVFHRIAGLDGSQLNKTWVPIIASHYPDSASSRTVIHFLQSINSRKFQMYDYGKFGNQIHYGQRSPPPYNLSNVAVPVVLMWATDDDFILPSDISKLASRLPNVIHKYIVPARSFGHVGFLYGVQADALVYDFIVNILRNFNS